MVFVLALAACPALHHAVHSDSNNSDHECLVTLFARGQMTGQELAPAVVLMAVFVVCAVLLPNTSPRQIFQYRFAPARAPPRG